MKKRTLIILFLAILALLVVLHWLGSRYEYFCQLTFGTWVKEGVYGEIKWKVPEDYCNRPLLFGLIQRM